MHFHPLGTASGKWTGLSSNGSQIRAMQISNGYRFMLTGTRLLKRCAQRFREPSLLVKRNLRGELHLAFSEPAIIGLELWTV
jgi:hypothetical protein